MGIALSCSGEDINDLNDSLGTLFTKSVSFVENAQSALRSLNLNGRSSRPSILRALSSRKLLSEGSISFNGRDSERFHSETKSSKPEDQRISRFSPSKNSELKETDSCCSEDQIPSSERKTAKFCHMKKRSLELIENRDDDSPIHEAALKLQKVYKSFRTRRQLADCAVLIEQRWWKLLDFALLRRSSVSFFDIEKQESAVSKWTRAKSRAAKVGKGLSKDDKAQKLALQHWLEAIDPRHRYGHNLNFYYDSWLQCESKQPFFYWLDVGEGKEVNLERQCSRSKLQQQCIKYLGPKEREAYEVIVEDGKFMYKESREVLNTTDGPKDDKWIFVLSTSKSLYVGQKRKGTFQHSSFLAGGATSAAGRLVIDNGILKAVWPHSGHYRPTEENFQEFMSFLEENNVDLSDVQKSPTDEDEELWSRLRGSCSEINLPEESLANNSETVLTENNAALLDKASTEAEEDGKEKRLLRKKIQQKFRNQMLLKIPVVSTEVEDAKEIICSEQSKKTLFVGNETEENLSDSQQKGFIRHENIEQEDEETFVPQEKILGRINSKKGSKSYQLGKQLSCKWTTGAGPRIGCVRDYPTELQFRTLEEVHLSPRATGSSKFASPRTPAALTVKLHDVSTAKEPVQQPQTNRDTFTDGEN